MQARSLSKTSILLAVCDLEGRYFFENGNDCKNCVFPILITRSKIPQKPFIQKDSKCLRQEKKAFIFYAF